jgi:hypothetical protein
MLRSRWVDGAVLVRAVVAAGVAASGLAGVDGAAVSLVAGATAVGLAAVLWSLVELRRQRPRPAALFLAVAALATPTYAAAVINLVPLALAAMLIVEPDRPAKTSSSRPLS